MDFLLDQRIRRAALQWQKAIEQTHSQGIGYADSWFTLPETGEIVQARARQNGIWKPPQMQASLSLMTTEKSAYDDSFVEDRGMFFYSYRTDGGYNHSDNRSLRLAMKHRLPMLYFLGIAPALFIVEVVLAMEEAADKSGVLLQVPDLSVAERPDRPLVAELPPIEMAYRTDAAKRRHHQREFRHRIMRAYRSKCAVCRFNQEPLLDAAHIVPDAAGGRPEVSNGLSLCRIHHGAYDGTLLGIDPDYRIHINQDLLLERDGPMLEHNFQRMNKTPLHLPSRASDKPDRDKLAQRFDEFRGQS